MACSLGDGPDRGLDSRLPAADAKARVWPGWPMTLIKFGVLGISYSVLLSLDWSPPS